MSTYNSTTNRVVNPETPFDISKILDYKHGKARFLNTIVSLTNQYEEVHPTQATVSKFSGKYCRSWGNRLINDIAIDGAINLIKRGKQLTSKGKKSYKDKTLIYELPDELYFYENRKILAEKYPAFRIWTPIIRERAIKAKAKNLTQLSSTYLFSSYSNYEETFSEIETKKSKTKKMNNEEISKTNVNLEFEDHIYDEFINYNYTLRAAQVAKNIAIGQTLLAEIAEQKKNAIPCPDAFREYLKSKK